jgi:hypothetical protein
VRDAKPGDVYVDSNGDLWRVQWTCASPTVGVVPLTDSAYPNSNSPGTEAMSGGVEGLLWEGFKRVYRRERDDSAS